MSTKPRQKADEASEKAQAASETPAKAGKTKTVTFKRSHTEFAYWPGDKADIDADKAAELIAGGFAE